MLVMIVLIIEVLMEVVVVGVGLLVLEVPK